MEKATDIEAANLSRSIAVLAKRLGIDTNRFWPVRLGNYPFFSIYCFNREQNANGKNRITKFDSTKYSNVELDEVKVISFPKD